MLVKEWVADVDGDCEREYSMLTLDVAVWEAVRVALEEIDGLADVV